MTCGRLNSKPYGNFAVLMFIKSAFQKSSTDSSNTTTHRGYDLRRWENMRETTHSIYTLLELLHIFNSIQ